MGGGSKVGKIVRIGVRLPLPRSSKSCTLIFKVFIFCYHLPPPQAFPSIFIELLPPTGWGQGVAAAAPTTPISRTIYPLLSVPYATEAALRLPE